MDYVESVFITFHSLLRTWQALLGRSYIGQMVRIRLWILMSI